MKTIQLQYWGTQKAIEAKNLKTGDITVWNFGIENTVLEIVGETKTMIKVLLGNDKGTQGIRKMKKTRLVGVK